MNTLLFLITLLLGMGVVTSYVIVFGRLQPGNYVNHPMWLGMNQTLIYILLVLQLLAAGGFGVALTSWIANSPTTGVFGDHPWLLPAVVSVFLVSAITWAPATYYKVHWLVISGLILSALSSIVLLAGASEESPQRWWIVVGLIFFACVTVLADGVLWNAVYIRQLLDSATRNTVSPSVLHTK
jgi:hypothetical protein